MITGRKIINYVVSFDDELINVFRFHIYIYIYMFLVCNYSVFICHYEWAVVPERLRNTAQNSGHKKNEHNLSLPSNNLPGITSTLPAFPFCCYK